LSTALIIYFSKGGTTATIAGAIAEGLKEKGCNVELCDIKDARPESVSKYDIIGLGSPVYYYQLPYNVTEFLKLLPALNEKSFFTFLLHATYNFDTVEQINKEMQSRNARSLGNFHCFGEGYFIGYLKRGVQFSPDHPDKEELDEATDFGKKVMDQYNNKVDRLAEKQTKPPFIYSIERFLLNPWLAKNVYYRMFKLARNKCTSCGICMDECPVGNISEDKNARPVWSNNCILCLYCELKCPENAISSPVNLATFSPFINYNLREAVKDPGIEHIPVEFNNGVLQRVKED